MSSYPSRTEPSYGYDGAYVSWQSKAAAIFGYGSFANYVSARNLDILPGTVTNFRQYTGKERVRLAT